MKILKNILFTITLAITLISCNLQGNTNQKQAVGEALGTTYQVQYFSKKEFLFEQALDSIFKAVNKSMSTYQEDSDISRINRGEDSVKVDTMFQEVFAFSVQVHRESEGFFDPTVGDLVNMYGFGPERSLKEIDSNKVDSLLEFVGLEKIRISPEGILTKARPEVYIDFNAIAKGYAIDVIGTYLDHQGVENYLIELGGELLARGKNLKKGGSWKVGIDDPNQVEGKRTFSAAIELNDRAMATSGNYRKTRVDSLSGKQYVHTINPKTGYPEKSNLLSATVLAENCTLADAYATAFMAMGIERSKEMLGKLEKVDVYFIFSREDGEIGTFATEGFEKVLLK